MPCLSCMYGVLTFGGGESFKTQINSPPLLHTTHGVIVGKSLLYIYIYIYILYPSPLHTVHIRH